MLVCKPPTPVRLDPAVRSLFVAGSIEMGAAIDWQATLIAELGDRDLTIFNPRRDAWDASLRQSIEEPGFREQVEWELAGLDRADVIAMWFDPDTHAPITLLELGLYARTGKLVVGCPDGFWRKGNVEIVCARFDVPLSGTWDHFLATVLRVVETR